MRTKNAILINTATSRAKTSGADAEDRRDTRLVAGAMGLLFLAALNLMLTICMCGHQGPDGLPLNLTAMGSLGWILSRRPPRSMAARVIILSIPVMVSCMLVKNIVDVLWVGHDPWLEGHRPDFDRIADMLLIAAPVGLGVSVVMGVGRARGRRKGQPVEAA